MHILKCALILTITLLPTLVLAQEICDNAIDDDGDGLVDLNDSECSCSNIISLSDATGYICRDNLQLYLEDPDIQSMQWYKDGIALVGENSSPLQLVEFNGVEGEYKAWIEKSDGCYLTEAYDVNIPTHEQYLGVEKICKGDTVFFGGFSITNAGFFQVNGFAVDGCDSITSLTIEIVQPTYANLFGEICDGEEFTLGDFTTTESGTHEIILENIDGCDSIITLELTEGNNIEENISASICEGEFFHYGSFSTDQEGPHELFLENSLGCDTVVHISLDVNEIPEAYYLISICDGDEYTDYGLNISESSIQEIQVEATGECDSLITIDIEVSETIQVFQELHLCESDTIIFKDLEITEAGNFTTSVINQVGCDSIFSIMVTKGESTTALIERVLCHGEIFEFGDFSTSSSIEFDTSIVNDAGCDSIISFDIKFLEEIKEVEYQTICDGDVIEFGEYYYGEEGIFEISLLNQDGCDSIIQLNLSITEQPTDFRVANICPGELFNYGTIYSEEEGIFQTIIEVENGCDSLITIDLVVNEIDEGIDIKPYHKIEYEQPTDIIPSHIDNGIQELTWTDVHGEVLGSGPMLNNFVALHDMHIFISSEDNNGCPVEARTFIDVIYDTDIYIPNIFSPSDQENNTFQIFGDNMIEGIRKIQIFDRWGVLMYQTENVPATEEYKGWDGTINGEEALPGVYTYIIEFTSIFNQSIKRTGSITLMR